MFAVPVAATTVDLVTKAELVLLVNDALVTISVPVPPAPVHSAKAPADTSLLASVMMTLVML